MSFATIDEAIAAISEGGFAVVVDDEDRENEGDLILAAEMATPEKIGFMVRHTSGLICVPLTGERLDELRIPMMVTHSTDRRHTAFTVSVDYVPETTTGISAGDRSATIKALVNRRTDGDDLSRPGHIFPLRYQAGGVLRRAGHTEAAVDLTILAGMQPAGVLAEIVTDDGSIARLDQLEEFAARYDLPIIQIADLIAYRRERQRLIRRGAEARFPTEYGEFRAIAYESLVDHRAHIALVKGDVSDKKGVLVRVHSECLTGDTLSSLRCDCGFQLRDAMRQVQEEGCGVVLYLRGHEGRGIGLMHKVEAYALQDHGRDTVEANLELGLPTDARDYGVGAQILADLGVTTMRLLTNNPTKRAGIEGYGLKIVETVPLVVPPTPQNLAYLRTKAEKLGHLIQLEDADAR
jgi:3,4-dihydroxy 2-butanone 4-phosphate synthase / GTP cyclohydrolase II